MRSLVFPALKVTFHLVAQADTFFRSLLSRLDVSSALSPVVMSVVSSANMCGVDSRSLIISFMNRINNSGPSLEPCGTPASTGCSEDSAPSTTVLAFRLFRYDFSRLSGLPLMFICLSFASRALCQTASKAADYRGNRHVRFSFFSNLF